MSDEQRAAERLADLRNQIREQLKQGLEAVNVHPRDEMASPTAIERVRAFHGALGIPEDPKFLRDDDAG